MLARQILEDAVVNIHILYKFPLACYELSEPLHLHFRLEVHRFQKVAFLNYTQYDSLEDVP